MTNLDAAACTACGRLHDLSDEAMLARRLALNLERVGWNRMGRRNGWEEAVQCLTLRHR